MGIQNKQKRIAKSKTPQPPKKIKGHGQVKTPQSAPPVKRKNLAQEIDEELSDVDFDELLKKVKVAEGNRSKNGRPAKKEDSEEDVSDDFSVDDDGEEQETSDDDEFDEDDDDDFSESDEDDEVSSSVFESPKITSKKQTPSKQKLAEMKSTPNKQKLLEAKSTPSKHKLLETKSTPSKQKLLEAKSTPSKQKLLEAKSTPSKQKLLETKSTPSKQKLLETKSTPSKQKLLEAKSTPSKQKLLEAKSTPNKQKLLEAKSTPSKQKLLETKKKTPSQEKLAQSTPGKLSEPVSAKKKNLPESKSGSDQKVLTKTASNQKLSGKLKTKAAQLLAEAIEDDDDDSMEEEESSDDEGDEEFDEDDNDDENDSDDDEEDGEDDDGDEEDESDNDVEVAPKTAVTVKEKQNEKKTVKKTDSSAIMDEAFNSEKSMLEERDKRTLFVKNLPENVTETQIKSLSADIVTVRIRKSFRQNFKNNRFAFLEFKNEKIAIKNMKQLKGRTIDNVTLVFDFVGQKSKNNPKSVQPVNPADIDPTKLFVTGFEREMTEAQLKALFPTANEVSLPIRKSDGKPIGFAFVTYASAAKCKEVHDKMQGHIHKGRLLIVLYGKKRNDQGKRKSDSETETPSKKQKKALAKEESSDDDSNEDGDDDDDDDDDEEMDSDDDEEMESGDDDDSDED